MEYLLILGAPEALESFAPTPQETMSAERRLEWYAIDADVHATARQALGSDFGGIWIGFDGTINVAYTSDRPPEEAFSAELTRGLPIEFHRRAFNELDASAEAELRGELYDLTTGEFVASAPHSRELSLPQQNHYNVNTMPGLEIGLRCVDDNDEFSTSGFRVTWRNQAVGGDRRYGYMVAGHALPDDCADNGGDGTNTRRIINENNVDVEQDQASGDFISLNKLARGIHDNGTHEMDAAIVRCESNKCGTRENNIHLAGSPKITGGGDDDPWPNYDNHDTEVQDVDKVITVNDTLCFTGAHANGVNCGWYGGVIDNRIHMIDFANGYPGPGDPVDGGDSGGPVYSILNAAGPRAVGIISKSFDSGFPFNIFWYGGFYRVDNAMLDITTQFGAIHELEICAEAADGSWDFDCD